MLKKLMTLAATALAMVGAISIVTPACIGWFYQPELPEELKKLQK